MKKLLLSFAFLCTTLAQAAEPHMPPDGVGGRNSHIQYSAALGLATTFLVSEKRALKLDYCPLTCQRFALALAPGVLKEVSDYYKPSPGTKHGLWSRKDLQADVVGAAIGVLVGTLVEGLWVSPGKTTLVGYATTF